MGQYLGTDYGEIAAYPIIVSYYEDNEMAAQEVRFCVPIEEWSRFQESPLFRDLVQYCAGVCQRIQDRQVEPHEPERKVETGQTETVLSDPEPLLSFWVRVRTLLRKILWR